jgi:hypothetical protein
LVEWTNRTPFSRVANKTWGKPSQILVVMELPWWIICLNLNMAPILIKIITTKIWEVKELSVVTLDLRKSSAWLALILPWDRR